MVLEKLNLEIKAKVDSLDEVRKKVKGLKAKKVGVFWQKDIYFRVRNGRLKLREIKGLKTAQLVYYERENLPKPKKSYLLIAEVRKPKILKKILEKVLGVLVVVEKRREIYMWKGVKIHLDKVKGLGEYLEFEKPTKNTKKDLEKSRRLLTLLMREANLKKENLEKFSYSDLLLKKAVKRQP